MGGQDGFPGKQADGEVARAEPHAAPLGGLSWGVDPVVSSLSPRSRLVGGTQHRARRPAVTAQVLGPRGLRAGLRAATPGPALRQPGSNVGQVQSCGAQA